MKKIYRIIMSIILLVTMTGCVDAETPDQNITILLSNNANNKMYDYSSEMYDILYDACYNSNTVVNLIAIDESSNLIQQIRCTKPESKLSKSNKKDIAASNANTIVSLMNTYVAEDDEVDHIKALDMAAKYIDSSKVNSLYIYTNGLSTTGSLDMRDTVIDAYDSQTITTSLQEMEALPDLSGYQKVNMKLGEGDGKKPIRINQ